MAERYDAKGEVNVETLRQWHMRVIVAMEGLENVRRDIEDSPEYLTYSDGRRELNNRFLFPATQALRFLDELRGELDMNIDMALNNQDVMRVIEDYEDYRPIPSYME